MLGRECLVQIGIESFVFLETLGAVEIVLRGEVLGLPEEAVGFVLVEPVVLLDLSEL